MTRKVFLLLFAVLGCIYFAIAQTSLSELSLETNVLAGSGRNLPFWMTHNQLGKYAEAGNLQMLNEAVMTGFVPVSENSRLEYGADLALLFSEEKTKAMLVQAYAGISGRLFLLKAGAFREEEQFGGLSSTNGEIVQSMNYRPYPMIRLATNGYIPFFMAKKWFRFAMEYDEGILTDDRVIDKPHLHHKSLMLKFLLNPTTSVTVGGNHYVFWGGYSDQYGQLPDGLSDYFTYVTGSRGKDNFLTTDQLNVAGDQLGSYRVSLEKKFDTFYAEVWINHPFEDRSGMEFANLKDNQYSLYFRKDEKGSLIDEFIMEYLYTKHQSGERHQITGPKEEHMRGNDNYFNHGIYQSGFSYMGYSLGTPFLYPLLENEEGKTIGFENTRVSAWHVGAKGYLSEKLSWKGMLSYTRNFGTFKNPYISVKKQVYSMGELSWASANIPLTVSVNVAADFGSLVEDRLGGGIRLVWYLN